MIPPGDYRAEVVLEITATDDPGPFESMSTSPSSNASAPIIDTWRERRAVTLTVTSADQPAIRNIVDPDIRAEMQRKLKNVVVQAHANSSSALLRGINATDLPMAISVDIVVRGKNESVMNPGAVFNPENPERTMRTGFRLSTFPRDAETIDIALVPNSKYAKYTVDVREIWGEEILLESVTVWRNQSRFQKKFLSPPAQ